MTPLKAYILDRFAETNPIYSSWLDDCSFRCEVVSDFGVDWKLPNDAGVVISHLHYRWEEIQTLRKIVEQNRTPVLILSDGILEYRNTWQNPSVSDGSIFQPLMGHKLACIGRGQARVVESWGNVGKCEVVGLPRLDKIGTREFLPIQNEGPFRLLVATANTPAFNWQQREQVGASLRDLHQRLIKNPWVAGRPVEVHWRLTDGLGSDLGISVESINETMNDASPTSNDRQLPLVDAIENVDAVVTTPSTLFLESVLKRRPTALLDYSNSPQYVSSAWSITAARHINPTLEELASPPAAKLLYQRATLHDQLECATAAKPRMLELICGMIAAGATARRENSPLQLPQRMLSDPQRGMQVVEAEFDQSALYPDNAVYQQHDVVLLQSELCQAVARLGQLPAELDNKNADIIRKSKHIADLKGYLEESWERIAEYRERSQQHAEMVTDAWQRVAEIRQREASHISALAEKALCLQKKNDHIESMEQLLKASLARVQVLRSELDSLADQRRAA